MKVETKLKEQGFKFIDGDRVGEYVQPFSFFFVQMLEVCEQQPKCFPMIYYLCVMRLDD